MSIATSEWQKPQTSHIAACANCLLVFDAIVARIPGLLTIFPLISIGAGAKPHRICAGETWDNFAI
jgi:hypothetical protein